MLRLLRHAESTYDRWNDNSRDVPLTDQGKRTASQLSGSYDLVICSTLKRSRQTLDYSKIIYGNILYTDLCREVLSGHASNLYNGETPHTETENDLANRIKQFSQIVTSSIVKYPKILVISHEGFIYKLSSYKINMCQQIDFCFNQTTQVFDRLK
jgi:broad specificity phosphatase PhoE